MLLFIYGTLKRGHSNNHLLQNSQYQTETTTTPEYRLYDCGHYPALIKTPHNGNKIKGEIWEIPPNTIKTLDTLEGTPWLYTRTEIQTETHHNVQGYLYCLDTKHLKEIQNGEWQ